MDISTEPSLFGRPPGKVRYIQLSSGITLNLAEWVNLFNKRGPCTWYGCIPTDDKPCNHPMDFDLLASGLTKRKDEP